MLDMQLSEYLESSSVDRKTFAETLGVHPDTLYKWQRGERLPRREMMRRIADETSGAVTANDFFEMREAS